jgi:error-prone DNA polymerase
VKDAQRHGLRIRPIDVMCSDWPCTLEATRSEEFALRLGLRYVKGLREEIAKKIAEQRALRKFSSIEDLKLRVASIQKSELAALAEIGALNFIGGRERKMHRRDALWQIERAARKAGPLFEATDESTSVVDEMRATNLLPQEAGQEQDASPACQLDRLALSAADSSPLAPMNAEERLVADFRGTGMTIGPHAAADLRALRDGTKVRVAGAVIARQRPGTANGFVFLSIEDETGIANAIVTPQLFAHDRAAVVQHQFVMVEGKLQNQEGVVSVKAERVQPLAITKAEPASHDFH